MLCERSKHIGHGLITATSCCRSDHSVSQARIGQSYSGWIMVHPEASKQANRFCRLVLPRPSIVGELDRHSRVAGGHALVATSSCSETSGTLMTPFDSPGESLLNLWHEGPLDEPGGFVRVHIETDDAAVLELEDKALVRSRDKGGRQPFHKRQVADEH